MRTPLIPTNEINHSGLQSYTVPPGPEWRLFEVAVHYQQENDLSSKIFYVMDVLGCSVLQIVQLSSLKCIILFLLTTVRQSPCQSLLKAKSPLLNLQHHSFAVSFHKHCTSEAFSSIGATICIVSINRCLEAQNLIFEKNALYKVLLTDD